MCKMGVLLARTVTKRYNKKKGGKDYGKKKEKTQKAVSRAGGICAKGFEIASFVHPAPAKGRAAGGKRAGGVE